MWQLSAVVFFLAVSHFAESRSPSYPFYSYGPIPFSSYGPEISRPFSVPGEIIDGIRVEDILETVGRAWNADRLIDGAALACDEFEDVITDLVQRTQEPEIVQTVCDAIRNSEIEQACNDFWDLAVGQHIGEDASISLVPGLARCRENNGYYPGGGGGGYGFSSYGFLEDFNYTYTYDWNPTLVEIEHEAMADAKSLYDFCSESGKAVEKINNMLFALMDWLGPSVFNSIYQHILDPYSLCSIGRYLLSMNPIEYIEEEIAIAKYPLADILEYLRNLDICHKSDNVGIELLKDLLVEFSDMNEDDFCEYVSEKNTREEYLETAATILENTLLIYSEEQRCTNVLSILAPLDEGGIHVQYVGFDLSVPSERSDFCQQVIDAYSPTSSFVPSSYRFPSDLDINDWEPFSTPGEFLPGLTLINLLEIEGAAYRAETIIEGVGVYCTVFEEFVSQVVDDETFDIASLCDLVKSGDLEAVEGKCRALLVPLTYYSADHPTGLKPFNPLPVAVYVGRQLTGISDISKEEVCTAADNLFNAQRSLGDLVKFATDIFIAEGVPSLHSVCQNWEEAVCYWKPYCPEPETNSNRVPFATTEQPFYRFYPYPPTPEEVEQANRDFDETLSGVVSFVLIATGFDDREALCEVVAGGIDLASGRAVTEIVEGLRSQVLGLLTDVGRCSHLVDTALGLLSDRDVDQILTGGNRNIVYQLTGFSSSEELCEALAEDFLVGTPVSPGIAVTDSNGKLVATYNVFMKIAVYLKDNVAFPF